MLTGKQPQESAMRSLAIGPAIGLCLATTLAAEPRQPPPLLEVVSLWLEANFELPAAAEMPALVGVSEAELVRMRYGDAAAVALGEVVAVYDEDSRAIYVAEGWT